MSTPEFIKEFRVKYIVAFSVLFALLVIAQGIIQVSLFQERSFRTASTVLDVQRARELYYADVIKDIAIDPERRTTYLQQLDQNHSLEQWQETEATLYSNESAFNDTQIKADFATMKPQYDLLKWAYLSVVQSDSGTKSVDIHAQLLTVIAHDTAYVHLIYDAYKRLDTDADNQVILVQRVELGLFLLSVGMLFYESYFAIRPALKQLNADMFAQQKEQARNTVPLPAPSTEVTHVTL